MIWKLNCPYYHEDNYFAKRLRLRLPLLSQRKIFTKIRQFLYIHLKIWTAPIITSWNFQKNQAVLLKWLENLNCPCYHELIFSKKYGRFYKVTWKFTLPLSSRGKIFVKIKQFCWSDLKIWIASIVRSSNFHKDKAVLLKRFKNLKCS